MSEDWRLRVELQETGLGHRLTERLTASELEHDVESEFQDRVVVSRDGDVLFFYTDTREQAEAVERLIRKLAEDHGWHLDGHLQRWHPVAAEWEEPDQPLPESDEQQTAEHEELIRREREEAKERGYPDFEVRVQTPSHADAESLEAALRGQGLSIVRRSNYVLVGAADEDSAQSLAERLRTEAPAGSTVTVEGNLRAVYDERPPNPFAFLGGLAG
jgi:hypothetical protein